MLTRDRTLRRRQSNRKEHDKTVHPPVVVGSTEKPFPWMKLAFWLGMCGILAIVLAVGVTLAINDESDSPSSVSSAPVTVVVTEAPVRHMCFSVLLHTDSM